MEFTNLKWRRIIAGGIAPHALSIAVLVAAVVGYTLVLAFGTGGEPDQGALQQFNTAFSTWIFPLLTILLTAVAAAWVVRRADPDTAAAHGFTVGLIVALIGLAFGAFDATMAVHFVSAIAAGVLGAKLEPVLFGE